MAGCINGFQLYIGQFNNIAIVKSFVRVVGAGKFAYINGGAGFLMYLQVRAYKIGMRVGFYNAHNVGFVLSGKIIIRLRITAGIDHDHFA